MPKEEKKGYVYLLASRKEGALYIGVTSNLIKRVWEHREGMVQGHTAQFNIKHLVYFEIFDRMEEAITREKQLKKWKRGWKIELIEKHNPNWYDLFEEITR
jgi:putative endonuclease